MPLRIVLRAIGSFARREKGGNRLMPGLAYMEDALKLSNQAPRVSVESLQTVVLMEHNTSSVGRLGSVTSFKRSSLTVDI
ncbi:hypothetical protein TNCV_3918851 [Trichonephila clavipes]|nr:hypothetical protein TNCV_3918851 [Trichonephila clavipes]